MIGSEFLLNRDDHAAFARAIQFRHDRQRNGFVEFARLVQRIHAGRRIEHQQNFVRRAGQLFAHDAMQLLQFLHQIVFRVQAAGGIDEEIIRFARLRGGDGIVRDGGGIGSVSAGDHLDFQTLRPRA